MLLRHGPHTNQIGLCNCDRYHFAACIWIKLTFPTLHCAICIFNAYDMTALKRTCWSKPYTYPIERLYIVLSVLRCLQVISLRLHRSGSSSLSQLMMLLRPLGIQTLNLLCFSHSSNCHFSPSGYHGDLGRGNLNSSKCTVACSKTDLQKSAHPEGNAVTFERGGFKQGSIYITLTSHSGALWRSVAQFACFIWPWDYSSLFPVAVIQAVYGV